VGGEDPLPDLVDPDSVAAAVAPLLPGCEGVKVGTEPLLAALENLDLACLVLVVDGIAFRGDGVTQAGVLEFSRSGTASCRTGSGC
jgi:hypothetical protein